MTVKFKTAKAYISGDTIPFSGLDKHNLDLLIVDGLNKINDTDYQWIPGTGILLWLSAVPVSKSVIMQTSEINELVGHRPPCRQ